MTDSSGQPAFEGDYKPFGEETSTTGSEKYAFTGQYNEAEIGLYYFGARWYDASLGRFISEDPLKGSMISPQSQNPYVYCMNNPLRYIDPSGMATHVTVGGGGQEVNGAWDMETGKYTFFTGPGSGDPELQDAAYSQYLILLNKGIKLNNTIEIRTDGKTTYSFTIGTEDTMTATLFFSIDKDYNSFIIDWKLVGYNPQEGSGQTRFISDAMRIIFSIYEMERPPEDTFNENPGQLIPPKQLSCKLLKSAKVFEREGSVTIPLKNYNPNRFDYGVKINMTYSQVRSADYDHNTEGSIIEAILALLGVDKTHCKIEGASEIYRFTDI